MNIALLEPDRSQAEALADILKGAGHTCFTFDQAGAFFDWMKTAQCDLLLLGDALDDVSSLGVLQRLHELHSGDIPVLLLVDGMGSEAILALLDAGVDDYLVLTALQSAELALRVQVLLRRAWPDRVPSTQLAVGSYVFDMQAMRLTLEGREVRLAQKEFELALLFFQHLGQPLSRATILDAVWGLGADVDPDFRSVDTHVARIRRKLHLRADSAFRLTSVYGYGYVLKPRDQKAGSRSADKL